MRLVNMLPRDGEQTGYGQIVCAKRTPLAARESIAGVLSHQGRVLGMMPHPERAMFFHQLPHWPYLAEKYKREDKLMPEKGPGIQIFENAINYFRW